MTEKYVYLFGTSQSEGDKEMRNLLGGKGANLAEMAQLGLPVPAGFTITTEVCTYYYNHDQTYPSELKGQVERAIAEVEKNHGHALWRRGQPALAIRALRGQSVHARHDGDRTQPRPQQRDRPRAYRAIGRSALLLRRVPPLRANVRRCGHGFAARRRKRDRPFRGPARREKSTPVGSCSTAN